MVTTSQNTFSKTEQLRVNPKGSSLICDKLNTSNREAASMDGKGVAGSLATILAASAIGGVLLLDNLASGQNSIVAKYGGRMAAFAGASMALVVLGVLKSEEIKISNTDESIILPFNTPDEYWDFVLEVKNSHNGIQSQRLFGECITQVSDREPIKVCKDAMTGLKRNLLSKIKECSVKK